MKKTFNVDVWDCKVSLCTTKESYTKLTKDSEPGADCLCSFDGRNAALLINLEAFDGLKPSSLWRSVSHEANHAAVAILEAVGMSIQRETEEALCYTQDYIFACCYEIISKELDKDKQ